MNSDDIEQPIIEVQKAINPNANQPNNAQNIQVIDNPSHLDLFIQMCLKNNIVYEIT